MHVLTRVAAVSLAVLGLGIPGLGAGNNSHLALVSAAKGPSGFRGICKTYDWACSNASGSLHDDASMMQMAQIINARVNRTIIAETDIKQYQVAERWTLPDTGRGDCEDYALLKKKLLMEAGVPAARLLLVTARSIGEKHAMLILRLNDGDYLLDNLTPEVTPWRQSAYKFLELQNPEDPTGWEAVDSSAS